MNPRFRINADAPGPVFIRGEIPPLSCPDCGGRAEVTTATLRTPGGTVAHRIPVVSCSECEHVHELGGRRAAKSRI